MKDITDDLMENFRSNYFVKVSIFQKHVALRLFSNFP